MPVLTANVAMPSREPIIRVENRLATGIHLFRLTVVDNAGNESLPALLGVTVIRGRGGGLGGFLDDLRDLIRDDPSSDTEDRE